MRWIGNILAEIRDGGGLLLVTIAFLCSGCSASRLAGKPTPNAATPAAVVSKEAATPATIDSDLALLAKPAALQSSQLLVVVGEGSGSSHARLYAVERAGGGWHRVLGPLPAMIGRHGFAAAGAKREGDGKSPSGLFPLELVFGYAAEMATRMPYRQAGQDDLWVDDVDSPQYNTWVRRQEVAAKSFEVMRLPDRRYRHGIVIGYNRDPIVKGKGSAIFVHVVGEQGGPTAGCVALDEGELTAIIGWLDPGKRPMIVMGNADELAAIMQSVGMTGAP